VVLAQTLWKNTLKIILVSRRNYFLNSNSLCQLSATASRGCMAETELFGPLKKTISLLIIDDDPELLYYYDEMLTGHLLYSITTAATARDAEHRFSSQMPHIVILDLGIDDIDGDEFYFL
jgi:PleD family two-component response regulator